MARTQNSWTQADTELLVRMYDEHAPLREMAKTLGKSMGSLKGKLSRLGLRRSIVWDSDEVKRLRDLVAAGMTRPEIAEEMGASADAIEDKLSKYKLVPERVRRIKDQKSEVRPKHTCSPERMMQLADRLYKLQGMARAA